MKDEKELRVLAKKENLSYVIAFLNKAAEEIQCVEQEKVMISLAAEEIFINIASYAYEDGIGEAIIRLKFDVASDSMVLTFEDWGKAYNPLGEAEPDITLKAEARQIGGLGIYMVKHSMDKIEYHYVDGKNILIAWKKLRH